MANLGGLLRTNTANENPLNAEAPGGTNSSPTFVTTQSLVTFPVASGVVTIAWTFTQALGGSWADSKLVPVCIAALLGVFMAWIGIEDDAWSKLTPSKKRKAQVTAVVIGAINTLFLAAASIGIDTTIQANT